MYSHLDQCTLQYLDLTKAERIAHIKKNRWIGYDHAKKLILKMEDLLRHPDTHRMPNLLIKAATNNGKSSILNRFADLQFVGGSNAISTLLPTCPFVVNLVCHINYVDSI